MIIGNPPYYANQSNENDENDSRSYPAVDKLIKQTYIEQSFARKTKRYDMYSRFFRWATNRLDKEGILVFITNSNFITSGEADGFRKVISQEFSDIYLIDLGGDVRANSKLSGTKNNVFGIQAGVAISFMVKSSSHNASCKIHYARRPESDLAEEKLNFLAQTKLQEVLFTHIQPDQRNNWVNLGNSGFQDLVEIVNQQTKQSRKNSEEKAIFKLFVFGTSTNRDEWVYENSSKELERKAKFMIDIYNQSIETLQLESPQTSKDFNTSIKWSESLKANLKNKVKAVYNSGYTTEVYYRPFTIQIQYLVID